MEKKLDLIVECLEHIGGRLDGIDNRLNRIECRLESVERKSDVYKEELEDLQLDIEIAECNIKRRLRTLRDEMDTIVQILSMNDLLPR